MDSLTTPREARGVQAPVVAYARSKGWQAHKLDTYGTPGEPDYIFVKVGRRAFYMEFKRPTKGAEVHQRTRHEQLRAAGFDVYVVNERDEGRLLVDAQDADPL